MCAQRVIRRGTVMVETALILFFLVFFMFLPLAINQIFIADFKARTEAYRNAFNYVNAAIHVPYADKGAVALAAAGNIGRSPAVPWSAYVPSSPADLPSDDLDPTPADDLKKYTDTFGSQNYQYMGIGSTSVHYSSGLWFIGDLSFDRTVQVIRGPWALGGLPVGYIGTVDFIEAKKNRDWFKAINEETIDGDREDNFKLKPLNSFYSS